MKNWVKVFWLVFFIGFSSISYGGTKSYALKNFKGIDVSQGLTVTVRMDSLEKVVVESDNDQFDDIELKISKGILVVRKKWFGKHSSNPRIFVSARYIEKLIASGGAAIKVQNEINSDYLKCDASSGADISVIARCKFIESSLSSGAQINFVGSAQVANITTSSGATFSGGELSCETVKVNASSGSTIRMKVIHEVLGKASSGAAVVVEGKPVNQVQCSSGGEVVLK
ncbi:MAG: head GIN domain-containing protein [Bacteroidales bacterium]